MSPQNIDLGVITSSDTVTREFSIINMTGDKLSLVRVAPSCTCTDASLTKEILAPKEVSILTVSIDPNLLSGKQQFAVTVDTDSVQYPRLHCTLDGWFKPLVLESEIVVGIGRFWPSSEIDLDVPIPMGHHGVIDKIRSECIGCDITTSVRGGNRLHLTGRVPSTAGEFRINLNVLASGGDWGEASVVLRGVCVSRWKLPTAVYLGFPTAEASTNNVVAFSLSEVSGSLPIARVDCSTDSEWLKVNLLEQSDFEVKATLEAIPDSGQVGSLSALLTVEVQFVGGGVDHFSVPVYARVIGGD